ncbi:hypothetical protein [uncultured Rhodospira sp.]|uniref:hypothetical protein n=1 Tax=uncultured Rhodospira sp. TaxID=1936189 RepID=UPI00260D0237|nr:hypothetical protein [uncultured Rhodospira sp.]
MSKSYVFVVQPSGGKTKPLAIDDAMHQILDLVEWLRAPARARGNVCRYTWVLKAATTNSPLTVEIAPEATEEGTDVSGEADADFARASDAMRGLLGDINTGIPDWLDRKGLVVGKRILQRHQERIGLTRVYRRGEDDNVIHITPHISKTALDHIELYEIPAGSDIPKHTSFGEVFGRIQNVGEYRNRPAFWILTKGGDRITCRLTETRAKNVGMDKTLTDVWEGKRVRVVGRKYYGDGGDIRYIEAEALDIISFSAVGLDAILDDTFTGGMKSENYVDMLRGGDG